MSADLNSLRIDRSLKGQAQGASTLSRRAVWIVIALLVLAGSIVLFVRRPAAIEVDVVRVAQVNPSGSSTRGDEIVLNATGYIVAAHKIELAAKVVGRVSWIGVDMGDKVRKGDVLVRLEDDEYRARVTQQQGAFDSAKARLAELEHGSRPEEIAQAKAQLEEAIADFENATISVERNRKMAGSNAISQQQIDDAEAKFRTTRAKVAAAEAAFALVKAGPRAEQIDAQKAIVDQARGNLELAKIELGNTIIRAPIDGTILERNVEVGEYVTTGFVGDRGAKGYVVSLANLEDLRVELDISQNDFQKITMNQQCLVTTDAYPDRKYAGVVDQISPQANRSKATVLVKVKVLQPDELLRPDMNASVAFLRVGSTTQSSGSPHAPAAAIVVPPTAVRDGKVFVVENGKAEHRPVEVGAMSASGVRINGGLSIGDVVIVNPPADLENGRRVRPSQHEGAAGS